MLPEVADREITITENRGKIGKQFQQHYQQQRRQNPDHSDAVIITPMKRIRRNIPPQQQQQKERDGKTQFFKLCVTVKNGKCIRKKIFGMWNSSRGNPNNANVMLT